MKTDEIKRRLNNLEQEIPLDGALCLVRLPDGSESEITLSEWIDHAAEWNVIKLTQRAGLSPLLCSLFSLIDKAVKGDQENGADLAVCIDHTESRNSILRFIEFAGGIS